MVKYRCSRSDVQWLWADNSRNGCQGHEEGVGWEGKRGAGVLPAESRSWGYLVHVVKVAGITNWQMYFSGKKVYFVKSNKVVIFFLNSFHFRFCSGAPTWSRGEGSVHQCSRRDVPQTATSFQPPPTDGLHQTELATGEGGRWLWN